MASVSTISRSCSSCTVHPGRAPARRAGASPCGDDIRNRPATRSAGAHRSRHASSNPTDARLALVVLTPRGAEVAGEAGSTAEEAAGCGPSPAVVTGRGGGPRAAARRAGRTDHHGLGIRRRGGIVPAEADDGGSVGGVRTCSSTSGWRESSSRTALRTAPVPRPWMTRTSTRPASAAASIRSRTCSRASWAVRPRRSISSGRSFWIIALTVTAGSALRSAARAGRAAAGRAGPAP